MSHLNTLAKMEELVQAEGMVLDLLRSEIKQSEEPEKVLKEIKNRLKAVEQFEKRNAETRLKSGFHWLITTEQILLGHKTLEEAEEWYQDWVSW